MSTQDLPDAATEAEDAEIQVWWRRSPQLAAVAGLVMGAGTLWFGNMLSRVPLDQDSTLGYVLMLPLLLIVPAFSAAGLRLAWLAFYGRNEALRIPVMLVALAAAAVNLLAVVRFIEALARIFSH